MMNITIVSENICRQLIKLQDAIAAREDGCPTIPEINMQVKLINSIDKLSRLSARLAKEESRNAKLTVQQTDSATQQPDVIVGEPPPVTGADSVEFSYMVDEVSATNAEATYKGKTVRVDWMLYNLFQFTLPAPDRRFIGNPDAMYLATEDAANVQAA